MKRVYLAIPYTGMQKSSYKQSIQATVLGMKGQIYLKSMIDGVYKYPDPVNIYAPIVHSHPIGKELPQTWEFWGKVDFDYIECFAEELWILIPKEGVGAILDSTGVQAEIQHALHLTMPIKIVYLHSSRTFRKPDQLRFSTDWELKELINPQKAEDVA